METEFTRDYIGYIAIFGMFGAVWFGWAQESPPKWLRIPLGIGSVVSVLLTGLGGYLLATNWGLPTSLDMPGAYETFGVFVLMEVLLCLIGALLLTKFKKQHLVSSWISLIVALHFLPLVLIFADPWLLLLVTLMIATLISAGYTSKVTSLKRTTIVCLVNGVLLLAFALRGLVVYLLNT